MCTNVKLLQRKNREISKHYHAVPESTQQYVRVGNRINRITECITLVIYGTSLL